MSHLCSDVLGESLYNIQRVGLQIQLSEPSGLRDDPSKAVVLPQELFQSNNTIVLDLDYDDVYVPERCDLPEFPRECRRWLHFHVILC